MKATRGQDTAPELGLRRELHRRGFRYRLHRPIVPGSRRKADLVFPSAKVAVFVDGCFWHGCPIHGTQARSNAKFWREKIETNRRRDRDTDRVLREAGWQAIRVWEHEEPSRAAVRIEGAVRRRRSH